MAKRVHTRTEAGLTAGCAMSGLLEMLTRPWTLHILWLLSHNGPMRFGALRRSAEGISARLLTVRLRTLEEKGFVQRTAKATNPPEVTYSPTPRLQDMELFMQQLQRLSDKWQREDTRHDTSQDMSQDTSQDPSQGTNQGTSQDKRAAAAL